MNWLSVAGVLFVAWLLILLVRLRWDPNLSRSVLQCGRAERIERRDVLRKIREIQARAQCIEHVGFDLYCLEPAVAYVSAPGGGCKCAQHIKGWPASVVEWLT